MLRKRSTLLGIGFGLLLALAQVGSSAAHAGPVINISDAYVQEGRATYVRVMLSAASDCIVTVNYATADGTAEGGPDYAYDYKSIAGTLTFAPGETVKSIRVGAWDDVDPEPDEHFFVNLSRADHATIGHSQAMVGIADNDDPAP